MAARNINKPFSESAVPRLEDRKCGVDSAINSEKLKILHVNVQSLRNKKDILEAFVADKDLHVVCITEHWLTTEEVNILYIPGYNVAAFSARQSSIGGGTLILVKEQLEIGNINSRNDFSVDGCMEYCSVCIRDFNLNVVVIYRSPSGHLDTFLTALESVLLEVGQGRKVAIAGDFNVHLETVNQPSDARAFRLYDTMRSFGLRQTIFEPTRRNSCLDNIFVNLGLDVARAEVVDLGVSDHRGQVVWLVLERTGVGFIYDKKTCRPITQEGLLLYYNSLLLISWDFIGAAGVDADQKFVQFMHILEQNYLDAFPMKTYRN